MSVGIDELFDMLSWDSDEETQRKGIELALDVKCCSVFLQPRGLKHSKDVWENCAKILAAYPDETLKYCLKELLEWLGDMNWPGAEIVLQRLIKFQDLRFLSIFIVHCDDNDGFRPEICRGRHLNVEKIFGRRSRF